MSSVFASVSWLSLSETSSSETSPCSDSSEIVSSISGCAVLESSSRSSLETCILSGVFLALLDGRIGAPLLEISPL